MTKFSIIVPVYNVEKYLAECLESLIHQTYENIEIVCVNDGSTDNSQKILDEYAAKDKRIIVIKQQNAGLSAARNTGISNATGDYLCYVDSDDTIELNACAILARQIQITHADILVFGIKDMLPAPKDEWYEKVSSPKSAWFSPFSSWTILYENGAYPYACRNCFRRSMLQRNNLTFDESVKYGEDIVYQFSVFPFANRIQFIPDKLYLYRRLRSDSLTRNMNDDTFVKLSNHINMMQHIYSFWEKNGFNEKFGFDLTCWILNFIVPDFKRIDAENRKTAAKKMLEVLPKMDEYFCYMTEYDRSLVNTVFRNAGKAELRV